MSAQFLPSVCPHDCPSACALDVERLAPDQIGKVRGAEKHPHTRGVICAKVSRYAERVHHPGRLKNPLKRVGAKGEGRFREISWDEALDETAAAFRAAADRYGSEAVWPYCYAGTMGLIQRGCLEPFRHALKYSRQDFTICSAIGGAGWLAGIGAKRGVDPREIVESDVIVCWGVNPVSTQVNTMTLIAEARKKRGAKLVVIDPYRTHTAEKADVHLALRPGTDGALACAMMHVLLRDNLADRDYLARRTDFGPVAESHLRDKTPAWAEAVTGVSAADIESFARLYASTKRSFIRFGYGMSRQRNGATNLHAASCLPAMTGAWEQTGGGALLMTSGAFARLDSPLLDGRDALDPKLRKLDMCQIGDVLTGDASALKNGPPVAAMITQNCNPAVVAPESLKVRKGLMRDDLFLCVHEQFLTDTAKYADIVLPATTFLEHDDLYTSYGHTFLQASRAVISPVGQSRSNHEVLKALLGRLGGQHPSFDLTAWEVIDCVLKASGFPGAEELAQKRWHDVQAAPRIYHFHDGFGHADGRFRFAPDWAAIGAFHKNMPQLPDHWDVSDKADNAHPFRLVTAPARSFLNTSFTETPTGQKTEARPSVKIHPDDAAELGIADGALVRIGNRRGAVLLHAQHFSGAPCGTLVVESIWPNDAFAEGVGINALTGSDPVAPAGGAAFHDTAVWLRAEKGA